MALGQRYGGTKGNKGGASSHRVNRLAPGMELTAPHQSYDYALPHVDELVACFKLLEEEGGDLKRAAARCDEELSVLCDAKDLAEWRDTRFPEVYVRAVEEHQVELENKAKRTALRRSLQAQRVQGKVIDRIDATAENMDPMEAAKALDALTKAVGTSTNVLLQHEGRPVNGSQETNVAELIGGLTRAGLLVPAEPVVEATVVDDPPPSQD